MVNVLGGGGTRFARAVQAGACTRFAETCQVDMYRTLLVALIVTTSCYHPESSLEAATGWELSEEFQDELFSCDESAVRGCLLVEHEYREIDCGEQPAPRAETNRLWCDWSGCRDTLSFTVDTTRISDDCYAAACPGQWRARAAFSKCERDLDIAEFEADYVGCLARTGCAPRSDCNLEQTEASVASFKMQTFDCAMGLYERMID